MNLNCRRLEYSHTIKEWKDKKITKFSCKCFGWRKCFENDQSVVMCDGKKKNKQNSENEKRASNSSKWMNFEGSIALKKLYSFFDYSNSIT